MATRPAFPTLPTACPSQATLPTTVTSKEKDLLSYCVLAMSVVLRLISTHLRRLAPFGSEAQGAACTVLRGSS